MVLAANFRRFVRLPAAELGEHEGCHTQCQVALLLVLAKEDDSNRAHASLTAISHLVGSATR